MAGTTVAVGDRVQTVLGKGTVREVRNRGQVLVEIQSRLLLLDGASLRRLPDERQRPAVRATTGDAAAPAPGPAVGPARTRELDLHGLTVEQAIARIDTVLDACMREDVARLRVIHGRSGGRLRAALHRRLAAIPSVRAFALDPANPGVTNVFL